MKHSKLTLVAQFLAAMAVFMAGAMKFAGSGSTVQIFSTLDMEPQGRYLIGFIEITAAMLLVSPFAALGALLSVAVMCGAIIAHATLLGFDVEGDHGKHILMLAGVLIASLFVLVSRRKELPIVGKTL